MEDNIKNLLLNINEKLNNLEQQNKQQSKEFNDKLDTLEKEIKDLKQGQSNKEQLNKEINEDDLYYFYIVSDSLKLDYFKIGITNNIKSRLSSIQTGNPNKVYLIDFLFGNKENIIQLEKTLKEKMSDYNLSGEWFKLEDEARMKLFNWLNKVKLNKHQFNDILDLESPKKDNKIENIKSEYDDKQEIQIKKLSKLKINEIIDLLKDYLKNVRGKLMFENNLTNDFSMDYGYLFEILEEENFIKNDLNKKDFNELFDKLNNEYLCCFEFLNKDKYDKEYNDLWPKEIEDILFFVNAESMNDLIGIHLDTLYKEYINRGGCIGKDNFIKIFKNKGFDFKFYSKKMNNKTFSVRNVLQNTNDKDLNKQRINQILKNKTDYFTSENSITNSVRKFNLNDIKKINSN